MTRSAISPRLAIRTFENTEVDCTRDPATPPRRSPRPPKKGYPLGGDKDHPGDAPNGIALSPDEKVLYVTAGFGKTMRYDVLPDDTVANGLQLPQSTSIEPRPRIGQSLYITACTHLFRIRLKTAGILPGPKP